MRIDFGRTADDYRSHRKGFPSDFFDRLAAHGWIAEGLRVLDVGTGTGVMARGLAQRKCITTALDISNELIEQSKALDLLAGVHTQYVLGAAEELPFPNASFDLVTVAQAFHWFDRPRALAEFSRVLVPGGRVIIACNDWIPLPGNIVELSEALIEQYNPRQPKPHIRYGFGIGIYPQWVRDLNEAGFVGVETFSYDYAHEYTHAGWRGRIRASQGVGASLSEEEIRRFDQEHAELLQKRHPNEPLPIEHRIFVASGLSPKASSTSPADVANPNPSL